MFNFRFSLAKRKESMNNLLPVPFVVWTSHMSVGVKLLDNDHKRLAILISELYEGVAQGRLRKNLERAFENLIRQTRIHFAHEEQLFAETAYPDAPLHQREHDQLMMRLQELQARFHGETGLNASLEVVNLLKGWIFGHIQSSDQDYVPHLNAKYADGIPTSREMPFAARKIMNGGPRTSLGAC